MEPGEPGISKERLIELRQELMTGRENALKVVYAHDGALEHNAKLIVECDQNSEENSKEKEKEGVKK